LWLKRNEFLFEGRRPSIHLVMRRTLGGLGSSRNNQKAVVIRDTITIIQEGATTSCFDGAFQ
jgi:hypothetical protein